MSIVKRVLTKSLLSLAIASAFPATLLAGSSSDEIEALWQNVEKLQQQVAQAEEWKAPNTLIHMAGYADVNYVNTDAGSNFSTGTFAPIFHYQVKDTVMLEAEIAFKVNELGETEVDMEYFTIDYFVTDYAAIVMGRFLSPLGQFRQNMHPSWINKLPSAPQGFGHGGAAPLADVGIQVRGGFKMGSAINANYAVYTGNGVAAEMEDGEVEEAHSPGFNKDVDGAKNFGGRFGIYHPSSKVDLGLSWATGKAPEFTAPDPIADTPAIYGAKLGWDFIGADVTWHLGGLDIRGEYVKQTYGAGVNSAEAVFEATYVQAAYRFPATKWEMVARTSTYKNPGDTLNRTTAGVNYIFTSSVIAKVAYEANDNDANTAVDKILVQMAYGF